MFGAIRELPALVAAGAPIGVVADQNGGDRGVFVPFFGLLSRAAKVYRPTLALFAIISLVGMWLVRYLEVYPSLYGEAHALPFGLWEIGVTLGYVGLWATCYLAFMNAFPRVRAVLMTSPYRDEVQVPVDPETMEPLPAHE